MESKNQNVISIEAQFDKSMQELSNALTRALQVSAAYHAEIFSRKADSGQPVSESSIGLFRKGELLSQKEVLNRLKRSSSWLSKEKNEGRWLNHMHGYYTYSLIQVNLIGEVLDDDEIRELVFKEIGLPIPKRDVKTILRQVA